MSWSCPAGVWVARGRRCPRGSLEVDGETEIAAGGLSSLQVCSGEERSSQRSASLCEYSQRHGFGQSMGLWLRGLVWGWEAFDSPPAQWRSLLPLWAQRRLWEGHTYAVGPNRPWTEAAGTPPPDKASDENCPDRSAPRDPSPPISSVLQKATHLDTSNLKFVTSAHTQNRRARNRMM